MDQDSLKDLQRRIYHMIAAEPQKASDIVGRIVPIDAIDVREAIWELVESRRVVLDNERVLRAMPLAYDRDYGDDVSCVCGHTYYRHFDTYADMDPVGCKYCDCRTFRRK